MSFYLLKFEVGFIPLLEVLLECDWMPVAAGVLGEDSAKMDISP